MKFYKLIISVVILSLCTIMATSANLPCNSEISSKNRDDYNSSAINGLEENLNESTFTVYHVSKNGDDTNDGSLEHPFLTISKAAGLVQAGDTVYIHEGTYEETLTPANSGTAGIPIVFASYPGDKVIITAMQDLSGWAKDNGQVYKTTVDWDLGQYNFVMDGTTACDLARWPNNTDGDPFTLNSKRNSGGSTGDVITNAYLTSGEIPSFDWSKGGSLFFYCNKGGAGWTAWKAFIKSSSAGKVVFDLDKNPTWIRTVHPPASLGDFYLEGIREALDYQNEWYFDPETKTLYIQLPGGEKPNDGEVEMRRRMQTINLNGRNYVEIRNLAVFGGSIDINGSNNTLYGVTSLYGNITRGVVSGFSVNSQSILVKSGSNNTIEKCEVGFGSGSGIWDAGTSTSIFDNYIHDFDYVGDYDAVLMVRNGSSSLVKNNVITRGGRDCIQILSKNSEVAYNNVSHSNLIDDDCGLLYTLGTGLNMKIHHNLFHDTFSRGDLHKAAGIYLDNNSADVEVHHNVVWNCEWSAIQQNLDCANNDIFNNTLINCSAALDAWHKEGTSFTNVKVWNNLSNMNSFEEQADRQNNLYIASIAPVFTDIQNNDFTLKASSAPIDYGRIIDGITDGYLGAAPDVGAYEFGSIKWTAGIDWDAKDGPSGLGCYRLPGDACSVATSVVEVPKENGDLNVFPNPVSDSIIQLVYDNSLKQGSDWSIVSMTGKVILRGTIESRRQTIDLYKLSKGIYIVRVNSGKTIYTRKIIKQ